MVDFSNMDGMKVTPEKLSEFTLYSITLGNANPVLIGRHAGESNKPFFNELLKTQAKNAKRVIKGSMNSKMLEENREEDLILFPKFVLVDWNNVIDAKGKLVPFNPENCSEFLLKLPNHIFDEVRAHFANGDNFIGPSPTQEDAEKKGKC